MSLKEREKRVKQNTAAVKKTSDVSVCADSMNACVCCCCGGCGGVCVCACVLNWMYLYSRFVNPLGIRRLLQGQWRWVY